MPRAIKPIIRRLDKVGTSILSDAEKVLYDNASILYDDSSVYYGYASEDSDIPLMRKMQTIKPVQRKMKT